jgi:hypothetical protein
VTSLIRLASKTSAPLGRTALCVLVAIFAVCLQACFAACGTAQEAPATYPVSGMVEDSLTHQPISRALVEGNGEAVLTDSNGHFELQLPASFTQFTVRRPGYETDVPWVHGTQHAVRVGPDMAPLAFYLTPSASITGHVSLSSGDIAGGLRFALYRQRLVEGHSRWMQEGSAETNSDGTFRLLSLEASASYVFCSMPSRDHLRAILPDSADSGYPGSCYPSGMDFTSAAAAPLKLAPGQQAQVEIALARQPFYPVSISVAGNMWRGGAPQVFDHSGRSVGFVLRNNQDGNFQISLPNGRYYAEVRTPSQSQQLYGRVDFTVAGASLAGLTLVPLPVRRIVVEVHREFTANSNSGPASGIQPDIKFISGQAAAPINLNWIPADKPLNGPMGANLRPVNDPPDNNRFEMDAPPQGTYWIGTSLYGSYVSSMTSGATDLLREPLTIGTGNSAVPIEMTLRNDMGWLKWRPKSSSTTASPSASNPEELPLVFVYYISQNRRQLNEWTMQGHLNEAPQLPVPPGTYLIAAFDKPQDIDLDSPEQMSRLTAHGQTVTVEAGATTEVQIDPVSTTDEEVASQ